MERKATAVWRGDVRSGRGSLSTESTSLHEAQYSFGTRFENGVGTNPEELLAAAHAGCFAMAVSSQLGKTGKVRCCRQRRSGGLPGIKTFQGGDFCRCAARGDGLMHTTGVVTG